MPAPYSQLTALLAITRASLKAIFRSPSAVIFSFGFPLVFILVFGFIGGGGGFSLHKVALAPGCDTNNVFFDSLRASKQIRIVYFKDSAEQRASLVKGRIAGVLMIRATGVEMPAYTYALHTTTASRDQWPQLITLLASINNELSDARFENRPAYALQQGFTEEVVREYSTIDFILPGQLGFSLLSAGVFGVAFMFFSLRNTLVLKRFFATPVSRTSIVLGEGLARVLFQLLTAVVIILAGYFFFGFTLVNGVVTLLQMLVLSFIGLLVFMGFGFIVSGVAKSESTIPPFANMITLPQFLLGGTFFSIEVFPKWLQPLCRILPLTHLNTAMRAVAFEGQGLWQVKTEIGILLLWGVVVYAVAVKAFKWE